MQKLGFQRRGLDPAQIEEQYPKFLAHYRASLHVHTALYPGVQSAIRSLRDAGYATAICTNKPEAPAEDLMKKLAARDLFDALVGADTLPVRKPDPRPYFEAVKRAGGSVEHSMLVGDSITDRDTARAAGVPIALVTFGPLREEVRDMDPDGLLESYDNLASCVSDLIG